MKITYDPEVDAAYIQFLSGKYELKTVHLSESVAADIAPDGRVVGIEVLDASENLQIPRHSRVITVENLKIV